jgi:ElaB/YqjD/DUF883 family membrane-anchored ribosome-binding protein
MATATHDKLDVRSLVDTVVDTDRLAKDAGLLKARASEVLDDGLRAVKRTAKQRLNDLEDLTDDATMRVRKAPLAAVAVTFAAGLLFGVALGWFSRRPQA